MTSVVPDGSSAPAAQIIAVLAPAYSSYSPGIVNAATSSHGVCVPSTISCISKEIAWYTVFRYNISDELRVNSGKEISLCKL